MSHSARERFATCHRLHFLTDIKRLELIEQSAGRRMGKWFARAIEHGDQLVHYDDAFDAAVARAFTDDEVRQLQLEARQVEILACEYMDRYPDQGRRCEVAFDHPIAGRGYLDGIIETQHGDWGIEDKLLTKFFWGRAAEAGLALRPQIDAYFYAMREAGTPLDKILFRVTFKPTITQDTRKGETLEQYGARLHERIAADPTYAFATYECTRTDEQLETFRIDCLELERQRKGVVRAGVFTGTGRWNGGCEKFGGCDMLPICREEPNAAAQFRVRPERPKFSSSQQRLLDILDQSMTGSATVKDMARQLGVDARGVGKSAASLVRSGTLECTERGRLFRPDARASA